MFSIVLHLIRAFNRVTNYVYCNDYSLLISRPLTKQLFYHKCLLFSRTNHFVIVVNIDSFCKKSIFNKKQNEEKGHFLTN
jgi:hypothetical protein